MENSPRPQTVNGIPWNLLNAETFRLLTFTQYPRTAKKSAILLANGGFAYFGSGRDSDDTVICYFCGGLKRDWLPSDDIQETHRNLSPDCCMVTGVNCNNIPMTVPVNGETLLFQVDTPNGANGNLSMSQEAARPSNTYIQPVSSRISSNTLCSNSSPLNSLSASKRKPATSAQQESINNISAENLAAFIRPGAAVQSSSDRQHVTKQTASSPPPHVNQSTHNSVPAVGAKAPTNQSARQPQGNFQAFATYSSQNTGQSNYKGPTHEDTGVITNNPNRSEHPFTKSCKHWPRHHQVRKEDLVAAGSYYEGNDKGVCCCHCGDILRHLKYDDSVWVEHARWFPECPYVRQTMGQHFVDTVQDLKRSYRKITSKMVIDKMTSSASHQQETTAASSRPGAAVQASADRQHVTEQTATSPPHVYQSTLKSAPAVGATAATNQSANQPQGNSPESTTGSTQRNNNGPTYVQLGNITKRPKKPEYALTATRFASFKDWSRDHPLKKEDLSEAGFYYADYRDCARCFHCGVGLRSWKDGDNVWVEHARWSPKCAYIRQTKGQKFVDTVQDLNKFCNKITLTMVTDRMNSSTSHQQETTAASSRSGAAVQALADRQHVTEQTATSPPHVYQSTLKSAPAATNQRANQPQGNSSGSSQNSGQNINIGPGYGALGIITERPKRPEFAAIATRFASFEHWPRDHPVRKEELTVAGFFYGGFTDCVRCFYCGGGMRNWSEDDNVYVEHARWFPRCAYIRQQIGQQFVDTVQDLNRSCGTITFTMVTDRMNSSTSHQQDTRNVPLERESAVLALVQMGYCKNDVIEAAIKDKEIYGWLCLKRLLETLEKDEEARNDSDGCAESSFTDIKQTNKKKIKKLKEENSQLRQQIVCKICMDKEVAVVFLPCGHLVSCTDCAAKLKDCPVCRNLVRGIVRAFMA